MLFFYFLQKASKLQIFAVTVIATGLKWGLIIGLPSWIIIWAPSSEFVSSSIPSWQILTAHARPFRGARDLAFCLKVPLDSLLVWASSRGSGETARMRRLAWTFAARIDDKYQTRLARPIWCDLTSNFFRYSTGTVMKWAVLLATWWCKDEVSLMDE